MPKYKGVVISDIHVGASDLAQLLKEYREIFLDNIKQMKKLDFLVVAGDFFDHKFYLNDKAAKIAYLMLKELVLICKEKNTALRFVYGTESHECDQYDIFSLLKIYENVKVIKYVEEEELLPDLNVLYLPEEHILNKNKYYKKYFENTKKYDYIFGHGVVREVMKEFALHIDTEDSKRIKVPVFSSAELIDMCKGQTYFGHYHVNNEYNDKIFSIGSFSRWKFGEEGRKGYYELECNTEKQKYTNKYIENNMADDYKTVYFGYDNSIFQSSKGLENAMLGIDKVIEKDAYNHIKFTFNIPVDTENPESLINYIKEKFKYNNHVKIEITNGYVEKKRQINKEKVETENEKFHFIRDESLQIEEIVSRFISIIYEREIKTQSVDIYLNKPLNEILEMEE